jgi:hypothetical protein
MTSDTYEPRGRLTRPAMIEEFQQARRRHRTRGQTLVVRRTDGAGDAVPVDASWTPEEAVDYLDLVRWGSDKG